MQIRWNSYMDRNPSGTILSYTYIDPPQGKHKVKNDKNNCSPLQ